MKSKTKKYVSNINWPADTDAVRITDPAGKTATVRKGDDKLLEGVDVASFQFGTLVTRKDGKKLKTPEFTAAAAAPATLRIGETPCPKTEPVSKDTSPKSDTAAAESKTNGKLHSRGRLGELCGFSVVAVLRTLGAAGVTVKQAAAIVAARGLVVNPHTVSIQIGVGKNGRTSYGPPAPLTDAQLAELKGLIPAAPAAAPAPAAQ